MRKERGELRRECCDMEIDATMPRIRMDPGVRKAGKTVSGRVHEAFEFLRLAVQASSS